MKCPTNTYVGRIFCRNSRCDDLRLECYNFDPKCSYKDNGWVTEHVNSGSWWYGNEGYVVQGIKCIGGYCGELELRTRQVEMTIYWVWFILGLCLLVVYTCKIDRRVLIFVADWLVVVWSSFWRLEWFGQGMTEGTYWIWCLLSPEGLTIVVDLLSVQEIGIFTMLSCSSEGAVCVQGGCWHADVDGHCVHSTFVQWRS